MSIHSQVFTHAHVLAKSLRATYGYEYRAAFSIALIQVWAQVKTTGTISLAPAAPQQPKPTKKRRVARISKKAKEAKLPEKRARIMKFAELHLRNVLNVPAGFPVKIVTSSSLKKNVNGCIRHADTHNKTEILIRNRKSIHDMIETLAHEMVHAQQVKEGRLVCVSAECRLWNGKPYAKNSKQSYQEYRNLPWEKEAFERQAELACEILNQLGI
ncbi:hypothetical protein [Photobacterium damselae]|uniref:hypothetical protein n=1 Tax=Photobacterium damselae TaxID=38293 RepID=UPI001F485777|nr:hypothetical protein [Photobacterium damselae]UKA12897.1 hypothetical protein IHC91_21495 [Photobacterium damselae subsp. damselae]